MKRILVGLCLTLVLVFSFAILASADTKAEGKAAAPKTVTVTGEIVDLGCYLGHGAKGEGHKECALKCIAGGMPMGLLTKAGDLFLLTMSHADAAPFNQCKEWAGSEVKVTGSSMEKSGMKAIEVKTAVAATVEAAK